MVNTWRVATEIDGGAVPRLPAGGGAAAALKVGGAGSAAVAANVVRMRMLV